MRQDNIGVQKLALICDTANYTHRYLWKDDEPMSREQWQEAKLRSPAARHDTYQDGRYMVSAPTTND